MFGRTPVLISQEERLMGQGSLLPVDREDLNKPWKKVTPEGLGARSFLDLTDKENGLVQFLDTIQHGFSHIIFEKMGWSFRNAEGPYPKVVDIVRDQGGQVRAILEWKFGEQLHVSLAGNGGRTWKEARSSISVDPETAERIEREVIGKYRNRKGDVINAGTYLEALRDAGLDDETVRARRSLCLKAAGLDDETLAKKRADFDARWRAGRGEKET